MSVTSYLDRIDRSELPTVTEQFSILFVCTGNIHRSAMAERLFVARVRPGAAVRVSSAGIRAVVGHGLPKYSAVALHELGANPEGHRARLFREEFVRKADLILTADTGHRGRILRDIPVAFRRTFTMLEFSRLAATVPPIPPAGRRGSLPDRTEHMEHLRRISGQRGKVTPASSAEDIADPVGRSANVTRQCAAQIANCVDDLLTTFGLQNWG
jgi:protein-tyrosine phosphatase